MLTTDCPRCKITIELESNKAGEITDDSSREISDGELYSFIKCPKCRKPIVTIQPTIYEINSFVYGEPSRIFPASEFHVNNELPELLKNSLVEAIGCYNAKLFTATVIMCRRTLDGFCNINNAVGRTLADSLEDLKKKGIINAEIHTWATALRLSGNEAAHDVSSSFIQVDAKDILDFTIAILDFSYSFKQKFDKFSQRRKGTSN